MMFSSNQILEISGLLEPNYIESALKFALHLSGEDEHLSKEEQARGCLLTYQIASTGSYCIGWGYEHVPEGWERFSFDFDYEIVSRLIKQQLEKQDTTNGFEHGDGTNKKGFLMKVINKSMSAESRGIKNPFYGIVEFEPYYCYYAK